MRAKKIRSSGEIITGADAEFNAFFTALAERLPKSFQTEGLRKEKRDWPPPVDRFAMPVSSQTAACKHNLPAQPTPFVGREAELAELARLLAEPDVRLVTILGAGGMGKTRLALEVAAAQMDRFAHGVYLTSLAPLQSVEAIVPTVAKALNFSFYEEGEPQQQLLDYLRQKTMLLIMDSFEHLLHGVGLVTEVLKAAPEVKILATSRARLNVQGEHLFPIAGMHFPDRETLEDATHYSAVGLFLTSARRSQPSFEPTADDLTDVVRICRLVEGMPLGILLAAAWVQMLAPAEIAAEIGQSLDFVETDLRDVPERQRSIRAVFNHSWNLLTEREREVFQGLSVFRGGFAWQAAQQVTGASLRELMTLVNKSLLHRAPAPSATPSTPLRAGLRTGGRYEVHELLRQYAAEKLDQDQAAREAVHDRHSAYYAAALQRWEADLKGPQQQTALAEIEADGENVRVAWNWAVEQGQVERLDQAIDGLCRFYEWRGRHQEGEAACRLAADKLEATASGDGPVLGAVEGLRVLAKILTWQSVFSQLLRHVEFASQLLHRSMTFLKRPELADQDTRPEKAFALLRMGSVAYDFDLEKAGQLWEQSLALYQALGDQWGMANTLSRLGTATRSLGVYGEAKQLQEESLAIRQALGDQRGIASSTMRFGAIALFQEQVEEAERLVREGIAIRQEIGDRAGIAGGLLNLGVTLNSVGKFAEAHSLMEESLAIYSDLGGRYNLAFLNGALGYTKVHLGRYEQARAQGQLSLTLSQEIGYRYMIGVALQVLGWVALAVEAYAEAQGLLQESVAVRRERGQRGELSVALACLGYAARGLGQLPQAGQHLFEALQTAAEIRAFGALMHALPAIALLLADQGEK
ncbi:MAG: tetratricopeptide repeat protein, partial [Anaerolineae bacterium]